MNSAPAELFERALAQPLRYVPVADVTGVDLAVSLSSGTCPLCTARKNRRHTFCFECYLELPMAKRQALYKHMGDGYEEAVADAAHLLLEAPFKLALPPASARH